MVEDKFADELMTDDELDNVAGGYLSELADDSRFLNVLLRGTKYHQCDRYGSGTLFFSGSAFDDVMKAWKSLGITCSDRIADTNKYYFNGREIGRGTALSLAEDFAGKHLQKHEWDW